MNVFIDDIEHRSRAFVFSINGCNRTYFLAADSEEQKTIWMKDILSCANEVIKQNMPLNFNPSSIIPSFHELQTPKRKTYVLKSKNSTINFKRESANEDDTGSLINQEISHSTPINETPLYVPKANDLFPENYDSFTRDELIALLYNVEIKFRQLEEEQQQLFYQEQTNVEQEVEVKRKQTW